MKLTAQQVFDATRLLAAIISEKRAMPQKGSYRLVRLHKALLPEYGPISEKYDALLLELAAPTPGKPGEFTMTAAFVEAWTDFAKEVIEVAVEPVPLAQLDLGPTYPASIRADELAVLGDLVVDDDPPALAKAA